MNNKNLPQQALDYHEHPSPGKVGIHITKPCLSPRDLSLAYSPGVAEPVRAIAENPEDVYRYTSKGNLVGVISNGSAILGLGDLGPLASKPVMEGKGVLFKKFADIDVFDIEVEAGSPEEFINTVASLAPTFGGINLEDIAAPHCFEIERVLTEKLNIPTFHDDQHGTAIIIGAALLNALELQGKKMDAVSIICAGAGSAAIASMNLLIGLGAKRENIRMLDSRGVIHTDREDLNTYKQGFAVETSQRNLTDTVRDADVFIGLAGPGLLSVDMLLSMAEKPIVFALSNPDPEIDPTLAKQTRKDLIMATGRSDFPNQVNNVLGFPFIFRGALDVRARCINQAMHIAATEALRILTHRPVPQEVLTAYGVDHMEFSPNYIIPTPLDPRLIDRIPPAVARAAVESGVAQLEYPLYYPE